MALRHYQLADLERWIEPEASIPVLVEVSD